MTTKGSNTTIDGARIDQTTRAQSLIDSGHHEVHEGRAFTVDAVNTAVAATGTLTIAAGNAVNLETMVIDTKTYTFRDAVGVLDGSIHIGATSADTIDNIVAAMGLKAGAGVDYGIGMVLHGTCTGVNGAGDTLVVTANALGVAGNAYPSTEAMANASWAGGATTLEDGAESDRILAVAFKTPDTTTRFHLTAEYISEGKAHFAVYEARTWTTSTGSQVSVLNRRRDNAATTTVLEDTTGTFADNNAIVKNPTALAAGTLLYSDYTWVNKNPLGRWPTMDEIVLDADTTYSFELTSDAGLKSSFIRLRWYEVADAT